MSRRYRVRHLLVIAALLFCAAWTWAQRGEKKDTAEYKRHVATYGPQSKFGYKDFIPRFTADNFDAKHWAGLFRKAGARYVVPVAAHHAGFPMYDCSFPV